MKKVLLILTSLILFGCASQLDIKEGDCSITMVEVDARASTPLMSGVEADGWVLVQRGTCSEELIKLYREALNDKLDPSPIRR